MRIGFTKVEVINEKTTPVIWDNKGTIIFDGDCHIAVGAKIIVRGQLHAGEKFVINGDTSIIASKMISFGDDCLLSWGSLIMDTDFHVVFNEINKQLNKEKPVKIGSHCWIGCNTIIKKGTELADGTVVAAGSVLSGKYLEENCIISTKGIQKRGIRWRY